MKLTDKGLVLREVKYGETSRILTVFTQNHGILSVSAKGSLNPKSKLFSASGLYSYSEWVLREGRKTYFADEAAPIEVFFGLRERVESLYLAAYIAELAQMLSPVGEESARILRLTLNSLYMLSHHKKDPALVKAVYEMRALAESGFMPGLLACEECGKYEGGPFHFSAASGTLLCGSCAEKREIMCNLNEGALAALRHIVLSDDDKLYSFTLGKEGLGCLGVASEQYALHHLHTPPRSLVPLQMILNGETKDR
ncbi:DNA repair protein RecO [Ruminococcaceae bacterium OttesenSCG-928-I18]|nr:DNA repair protein RecO [Ruminococcaceae bacterium OttesenSCG-928-I18]